MRLRIAGAAMFAATALTLSGCGGDSKPAAQPAPATTAPPSDPIATATADVTDVDAVLKAVDEDLREADAAVTTEEGDLTK